MPAVPETLRTSRQCRAARLTAAPRWLPASLRQSRSSSPSAASFRPALLAPIGTPPDAFPHPSTAWSARWSSDPARFHPGRSARTTGSTNCRWPATRSRAPNRSLRNSRPSAVENKSPAPIPVDPLHPRRTARRSPPRTRRTSFHPRSDSAADKTDGSSSPAVLRLASITLLAAPASFVAPSP